MGKYKQDTKSILISSIPPEEMKDACKEWANGNEVMAEFLYTCYEKGLETFGNHFGPDSYIDFIVNDSHETMKSLLSYMQNIDKAIIFITPDGASPLGNEEAFWKPSMSIGFEAVEPKEEGEKIIKGMTASINSNSSKTEIGEGAFEPLLDIYDFFAGKGSNLNVRAQHDNGQYKFDIESRALNEKNLKDFNELFENAGLSYEKDGPYDVWAIVSDKKEEFRKKIIKAKEIIETNWTYEKPTQIEEYMGFNEKARIKMEQLGKTPQGIAEFKKWLEEEQKKMLSVQSLVKNALRADNQNVVGNEMTDEIDKEESIEQENIEDKGEQINE